MNDMTEIERVMIDIEYQSSEIDRLSIELDNTVRELADMKDKRDRLQKELQHLARHVSTPPIQVDPIILAQRDRLREGLDTMIAWHDQVQKIVGPVPSPFGMEGFRAALQEVDGE